MVERNLYKTKLCVLYQRGRCSRQTCSFAHGDAELRRSFASYNGRRNNRDGDLRDKLRRRLSPQQSHSPGRDARGRHRFRGHSPSKAPDWKSDRKRRKKQHPEGHPEMSGSLKISDGTEDQVIEGKLTPYVSKFALREQLQEVQLDINVLEHQKLQLELFVEEKVQEADILSSRIMELETQLQKEKDDNRRIASKVKKFVKAHNRHSRIQDELKRSQARIQKLADQLGSDATGATCNGEDSCINVVSDGETTNLHLVGPPNDMQTKSNPNKRKLYTDQDTADESMPEGTLDNLIKAGGQHAESIQLEKVSQCNLLVDVEVDALNNLDYSHGPVEDEGKPKQGNNVSTSISSAIKLKSLRSAHVLPSTSMAAHAVDEEVELDVEKIEEVEMTSAGTEKGATYVAKTLAFRLPPPPPIPANAYLQFNLQYVGDDENVDVVG